MYPSALKLNKESIASQSLWPPARHLSSRPRMVLYFPWLTLGTFLPSSPLCCGNESEFWLTEKALVALLMEGHRNCFRVRDPSGFPYKSWSRGSLRSEFLNLDMIIRVVKGCPVHGGMLTCILGLYPPDAKSTSHSCLIY